MDFLPQNYSKLDIYNLMSLNVKYLSDLRKKAVLEMYRTLFLNILGEIYFESAYAYACLFPGEKTFLGVSPFFHRLIKISEQTKNRDVQIKAKVISSYAFYSLGNHSTDLKKRTFFNRSFREISSACKNSSDSHEVELMRWRHVALSSVYLGDESSFNMAANKIQDVADKNKEDTQLVYLITALGTVARGQAFFKDSRALNTLSQVKKTNKRMIWRDPLRTCETLWNEIQIIDHLNINDKNYRENLFKEGINIAEEQGYFRYVNYFTKAL